MGHPAQTCTSLMSKLLLMTGMLAMLESVLQDMQRAMLERVFKGMQKAMLERAGQERC